MTHVISLPMRWGWAGDTLLLCLSLQAESDAFRWLICQRKGDEILALDRGTGADDTALQGLLDTWWALPIVIYQPTPSSVEGAVPMDHAQPLHAVLGVAVDRPQDFVYQCFPMSMASRWTVVLRKDRLAALWARLGWHQQRVLTLYLSPVIQGGLLSAVSGGGDGAAQTFSADGRCYRWAGQIEGRAPSAEVGATQLAAQLDMAAEDLGAYAAALAWHQGWGRTFAGWPQLPRQQQAMRQRQLWLSALVYVGLGLSLALVLLLGSAGWLRWQTTQLEIRASSRMEQVEQIRQQGQDIARQARFIAAARPETLRPSQMSRWIDEMAQRNPRGLQWEHLWVRPPTKVLKKQVPDWQDDPPLILLQGEGLEAVPISAFTVALQEVDFIARAEIARSQFDFERQAHRFVLGLWLTVQSP